MNDVVSMMNEEQKALIHRPKAWENTNRLMGFPLGATPFQMTGHFHTVMGMETPEAPIVPAVSQRYRRAALILEEFLELLDAMGFELRLDGSRIPVEHASFELHHVEGSRYDLVETADALGDLNVVVNGTGVEFGIPMHFIDYEVYTSNLSKVNPDGTVIVNYCKVCGINPDDPFLSDCECDSTDNYLKPDAPVGKVLKPEGFVPCNIPAVLKAFQDKEI